MKARERRRRRLLRERRRYNGLGCGAGYWPSDAAHLQTLHPGWRPSVSYVALGMYVMPRLFAAWKKPA